MTIQRTALWRCSALASAVFALSACGGGGGGDNGEPTEPPAPPAPPPVSTPTTQELVQAYVQANEQLLATHMPAKGADRYALLDACYLGQGSTKAMVEATWDATPAQAQDTAYQVGRKLANVQVLDERKTTNADGSARHEVDIGFDEQYTDGTSSSGLTETLVSGSSSGTCATPQKGEDLRVLGNQRVLSVGLLSRNRLEVFRQLADGTPAAADFRLRRDVQFRIVDPAKAATYVVVSWKSGPAGDVVRSLKFLSPRIARDAAEMQGRRGNANWIDGDRFRHCPSNANDDEANAATADCTTRGMTTDTWGSNISPAQFQAGDFAGADARFANWGLDKAGAEVAFAIHGDDGWKTVNGQQGKTPIATYTLKLKNASYPFTQLPVDAYPMFNTIEPAESAIVVAFKAGGGTATPTLQAGKPPAGGAPVALTSLYSFRQGPRDASATGPATVRTASMPGTAAADGKTATIPFGGKPEGASATTSAEFGLDYGDRNGRAMSYALQYN